MTDVPFAGMPKMYRISRGCIITEKIDGTNAQVYITPDWDMFVGSKRRWIQPENDNAGFAKWAYRNKDELLTLGPGQHFGEWWGSGIQRGYGLQEKRFSLFDTNRWAVRGKGRLPLFGATLISDKIQEYPPTCCDVVPELYRGDFSTKVVDLMLDQLIYKGSRAAPGCRVAPEGVVVYHLHSRTSFKKTYPGDGHKGKA